MLDKEEIKKETKDEQEFSSKEYAHLFEDKTKLIDCPKEIVFTVLANVLSQNEKGEFIGSNEICKKNYHIPVPEEQDYHIFMNAFFALIENCLSSSAKKAYNPEDQASNE